MAKVTGPFMSLDASGTIYGALTASIWKGRNYIRAYRVPTNPSSADQVTHRALFAAGVLEWQGLDAEPADPQIQDDWEIKSYWNTFGSTCIPTLSGFNCYVKHYIAQAGVVGEMPSAPFIGKKGIHG